VGDRARVRHQTCPSVVPDGQLFLTCPRCGLRIGPRAPWLAIEHCPRCLAHARLPVKLVSSPPPSESQRYQHAAPMIGWSRVSAANGGGAR
jgi:hypothetical protein